MRRAVEARDTLALMPTGAGKSLCYQLAAMLRPTPTLVISPLIALMKDQIDNLPTQVGEHASLINSSLDPTEAARRLQSLSAGEYKLIYAAPERLRQRPFVTALKRVQVGLVVIDEVHCVSMWGHDFRPDYLFIRSALEALGRPAVLGLTATATPATEGDISEALGRDLEVVRTSVVRPNLRYEVEHVANEESRLRSTLARVKSLGGAGIIYARARRRCERIARLLAENGVSALHYHAGLESEDRTRVQESFLKGGVRVIVATTAFGMGIDKSDIRWILLYNFPSSLESYVQMVGRAGRDGEPSACVLLASKADATNLRKFARADVPSVEHLRSVYRALRSYSRDGWAEVSSEELLYDADLPEDTDPRVLVGMLERAGLIRRDFDAGRAMNVEILPPPEDAGRRIQDLLDRYDRQAGERAGLMIAFADSQRCRHLQVAEHFGETVDVPCGMCDDCEPGAESNATPAPEAGPLPDDIAGAIMQTVGGLQWPLGQRGLVALLRGSVAAPRSARHSPSFGILAAAPEATVKRWIGQLVEGGHLASFESEDGFKLLRAGKKTDLPDIRPSPAAPARGKPLGNGVKQEADLSDADSELFERLRAWRLEKAREASVPAYAVMSNQALLGIASARPASDRQLAAISGIGPSKIEQYGHDILALVRGADPPATD